MLNGLFELISGLLNFFYELVPDYGVAIAMLTCTVMVITTPLTLKSTRSMIEMQRFQPEIRKLQVQYKDDRQKLNEEMMAFYKAHNINPLGSCLPMLVQLPVFSILFYVVRGLTNSTPFVGVQQALIDRGIDLPNGVIDGFRPKYLPQDSALYRDLLGQKEMLSAGVDLAITPGAALGEGVVTAIPYVLMLVAIAGMAWYQQKQIMGRNSHAEVTQQQRMMMRIGPVLQVGFTFISPAALGIYFLISTAWRVAQQSYITRSLYGGEESVGVQAQKAMAELRAEKKAAGNGGAARSGGGGGKAAANKPAKKKAGAAKKAAASSNGSSTSGNRRPSERAAAGSAASGPTGPAKAHPRSRKKKKRK